MDKGKYFRRTNCRLCKNRNLTEIVDLGMMPLAGNYLLEKEIGKEKFYPLKVYLCKDCSHVQILHVVSPNELFKDYRYLSSVGLSKHFQEYARTMVKKFKPKFVVEIGSNDGVLLAPLQLLGIKAIGVDPAHNVAQVARYRGLKTIIDYFTPAIAEQITKKYRQADAIFANNVLAHIDDLGEVMEGVQILLRKDGILVFEVAYLVDLLDKMQFDIIYHEHLSYHSLSSLIPFLSRYDLEVFDVERISTHAGSIRVYVQKRNGKKHPISSRIERLLTLEQQKKLFSLDTYLSFREAILARKTRLLKLLNHLKAKGKRIVGYGAPGRGNILLNFYGIGRQILDYIVDESPERYGRFTPGVHIPIISPDKFREDYPDYVLLMAYSYEEQIKEKEKEFIEQGGKFILPL